MKSGRRKKDNKLKKISNNTETYQLTIFLINLFNNCWYDVLWAVYNKSSVSGGPK